MGRKWMPHCGISFKKNTALLFRLFHLLMNLYIVSHVLSTMTMVISNTDVFLSSWRFHSSKDKDY